MSPRESLESPFWSWSDVAVLTGLVLPCLLIGAIVAQLLGSLSPVLQSAKAWTAMLLFYLLWFGALFLLLKARYGQPFWRSLGFWFPHRGAMLSLLAGPVVAMMIGALGLLLRTPQQHLPLEKLIQGRIGMFLFGVFSIVLGPVTEELAFRGFLLPLAIRSMGALPGIVAAAIPFALLHGPEYAWTWQYIVLIGLAGALFGAVRYYTGSTLASALMHSTYNLMFFAAFVSRGGGSL